MQKSRFFTNINFYKKTGFLQLYNCKNAAFLCKKAAFLHKSLPSFQILAFITITESVVPSR